MSVVESCANSTSLIFEPNCYLLTRPLASVRRDVPYVKFTPDLGLQEQTATNGRGLETTNVIGTFCYYMQFNLQ